MITYLVRHQIYVVVQGVVGLPGIWRYVQGVQVRVVGDPAIVEGCDLGDDVNAASAHAHLLVNLFSLLTLYSIKEHLGLHLNNAIPMR